MVSRVFKRVPWLKLGPQSLSGMFLVGPLQLGNGPKHLMCHTLTGKGLRHIGEVMR